MSKQVPLVAHIIYALGTGGLENGLVNIINRASPDRYRHVIICLTEATEFANRITAPNVEVIQLHKRPGHDLKVYWRLLRTLWRLKPAIVHTRNLAALEMQALTLLLPGVKRVHGEHGRDIYDLEGKNKRYNQLRRALAPFIHRFITVSQDLEHWLKDTVGVADEKVVQLYNGIDQQRFLPQQGSCASQILPAKLRSSDRLMVGTVGRIAAVKDQKTLISAFAALLAAQPQLKGRVGLMVVGDGPLFQDLKAQVETLGLQDDVWLPGDRKDIPELLQAMDIFVLPSLGEGISNTVLEAMATGLPVIATAVGGNPELVIEGETGYLFPVGDEQALTAHLEHLLADSATRQRMGHTARDTVSQQFSWDSTVAGYLAVYDEILG